jgi:multimeric flavodoxin WrbA
VFYSAERGAGKVRIVGISSSPRHANTEFLVQAALSAAEEKFGAVTELISFKGKRISGCLDCKACERRCQENPAEQCVLDDDWGDLITPLVDPVPDGLLIGSPVYFLNVNAQLYP